MKIAVFNPENEFIPENKRALARLGRVVYTQTREELPLPKLIKLAADADILMVDPDNLGSFEKGKENLKTVIAALPNVKTLALSTTSYGWVDLGYCRKRGVKVCNIPGYSRESVAEHTIALLLCLAKRILITDRQTQKGEYKLERGFELYGKTLGIIGLGSIGSRVAQLGQGIGMKVIAYNRSPKIQAGVQMKSLGKLLRESDAISLNVKDCDQTIGMIGSGELAKMKDGVIIVNTAGREVVDEEAMAKALKFGKIYGYAFEAEDLESGPLARIENAIGLKGFGWYTNEALANLQKIWVQNVLAAASGHPQNIVTD
ncbi:MAG: Lactate dehydrogenase-like protein oxidoreductase [Microgenomates group bacterium GW2011_GWA1_Microgenomates_45_10]|nr:MAG: Lactate dehydrogenase-like protein oxidoreductase [Microgenomates group bacterium GW2011_GWB1_44_8]KKT87382.1 MAG: Lactate dehydrogenase-like protein oxidoreductase [Microgenomates group bacterium GW2011_GWA1_Microgenomates_45_10]